jgi:hypothetical protein
VSFNRGSFSDQTTVSRNGTSGSQHLYAARVLSKRISPHTGAQGHQDISLCMDVTVLLVVQLSMIAAFGCLPDTPHVSGYRWNGIGPLCGQERYITHSPYPHVSTGQRKLWISLVPIHATSQPCLHLGKLALLFLAEVTGPWSSSHYNT